MNILGGTCQDEHVFYVLSMGLRSFSEGLFQMCPFLWDDLFNERDTSLISQMSSCI